MYYHLERTFWNVSNLPNQVRMLQFKAINLVPTYWIFTLPLLGDAVLDKSDKFEGKTSMAFCYKYLPIVDHLRKLDDKTLIGKMKIGSYTIIYFTLTVPGNWNTWFRNSIFCHITNMLDHCIFSWWGGLQVNSNQDMKYEAKLTMKNKSYQQFYLFTMTSPWPLQRKVRQRSNEIPVNNKFRGRCNERSIKYEPHK